MTLPITSLVKQMTLATTRPPASQILTTEAQLRALIGEPAEVARAKISHRLNALTRLFGTERLQPALVRRTKRQVGVTQE